MSGNQFTPAVLAYVALGSNLGDSVATLRAAMDRLREHTVGEFLQSSLWQTSPVDCPPGSPRFVNAVVAFAPSPAETPERLLNKLQALEREFGRQRKKVLNEARPLDLDLIAFGNEAYSTPTLTLPHPRAHLRRFVLQPLAEIAPDLILPGQEMAVRELLQQLRTDEHIVRLVN